MLGTNFGLLQPPRWEDPLGNTHFVSYIADSNGYRVVDSDVIPATVGGVRANGNQVSSLQLEGLIHRYILSQKKSIYFITVSHLQPYIESSFHMYL